MYRTLGQNSNFNLGRDPQKKKKSYDRRNYESVDAHLKLCHAKLQKKEFMQ